MLAGEPRTTERLGCCWVLVVETSRRDRLPTRNTDQLAFPHPAPPAFDNRDPGSRYILVHRPGSLTCNDLLHPFTLILHVVQTAPG